MNQSKMDAVADALAEAYRNGGHGIRYPLWRCGRDQGRV
jgi:hypothetical protein